MVYPSPPLSEEKTNRYGIFSTKKTPKPFYYEDVYGSPNSDEEVEGKADVCGSESDSGDEKSFSKSPEYQRLFGGNRKKSVRQGATSDGPGVAKVPVADGSEDSENERDLEFKTNPKANPRQSLRTGKLLVPRKYGIFAASSMKPIEIDEASEDSSDDEVLEEEKQPQNDTEEEREEDEEKAMSIDAYTPSPTLKKRVSGRMERPETRPLLSQQLREKGKAKEIAKREAIKSEKTKEQAEKEAKRSIRDMANAEKKAKNTIKKKADKRKAFALLEDGDVDLGQYRRYD